MGRVGCDGRVATATIIYSASNIDHASTWLKQHYHDQEYCTRILNEFGNSWNYATAHYSSTCRQKVLLNVFGKESNIEEQAQSINCCDVCNINAANGEEEILDVS